MVSSGRLWDVCRDAVRCRVQMASRRLGGGVDIVAGVEMWV